MKAFHKRILFITADATIIFLSYWAAAYLRYDFSIPREAMPAVMLCIAISVAVVFPVSVFLGAYKDLWRFIGIDVVFRQAVITAVNVVALITCKYTVIGAISGSITIIYAIILFVMTTGARIIPRALKWLRLYINIDKPAYTERRPVIFGAGETGTALIKRAREAKSGESFYPVAIVDNDKNIQGSRIAGVKVAGTLDQIKDVCTKYNATEIIVALPNATKDELYDIYKKCIKANLPIKSAQRLIDVKDFLKTDNSALKSVTIEDLLFRSVVENDMTPVREFLQDKTVLVTGGAGSIGSELCRQALDCGCRLLIIFDIDENGLYDINEELSRSYDESRYVLCLGSIRDILRVDAVMKEYKPYVVFHAAAHKHVPMLEINPFEAVKNNVKGTKNVIEACIANKVHKFILISTDKAVNPVNMLGASKRVAEMLVENMKVNGVTQLAAVRFGNVLGSAGSVIPKFKKQIEEGGPVTVTHKEVIRFFMTISEAVSLVLTAGVLAKDGEIFVLDMGQPVKIYDLAVDLIRLSGFEPGTDIEIKEIGLRAGEKLYEELFLDSEQIDTTSHEKIFILKTSKIDDFSARCENVINIAAQSSDEKELRKAAFELVGQLQTEDMV